MHGPYVPLITYIQPEELIRWEDNGNQGDIEYEMNEEDHVWLENINHDRTSRGCEKVTQDQFEHLKDRLEKEAFFESNKPATSQPIIDEEAVCCVCNDGEVFISEYISEVYNSQHTSYRNIAPPIQMVLTSIKKFIMLSKILPMFRNWEFTVTI